MTTPYIARQNASHIPPTQIAAADGAITITDGRVVITKASAAALTLAAPTAGKDDFKRLLIISATAAAHTVTVTAGFNGGGASSDVATFSAAIGSAIELMAYNGIWLTVSTRNVTLA